jgi:hypothetical protein
VAAEKRTNQVDDLPGCDRIGKKPVEARAVVPGSEIAVIVVRSRANDADLGQTVFGEDFPERRFAGVGDAGNSL